jgi:hypothetical protein
VVAAGACAGAISSGSSTAIDPTSAGTVVGMLRTAVKYLLAALLLPACVDRVQDPGDEGADATTAAPTGGETTADTPTTGETGETGETDGTTSAAETTDEPPHECWYDIQARAVSPRVMLLLDKSSSMVADSLRWDHDGDDVDDDGIVDGDPSDVSATPKVTRWRSLYATVEALVGDFAWRVDMGAVLFPALTATQNYSAAACPVLAEPDVPVGPDQGALILATIPAADAEDLHGATPATAGVISGLAGLAAVDPEEASRPRYLVLITDGAANCPAAPIDDEPESLFEDYDVQLPVAVAEARAAGVPTFVIGIAVTDEVSDAEQDGNPDGTNTFERLNEVAEAGGVARPGPEKFYNAGDQDQLMAALLEIAGLTTSCTLEFSQPLHDGVFVEQVDIDPAGPAPLFYGPDEVQDCAAESGWRFTDESRSGIELCGEACSLYRASGVADIRLDCDAG